MLLAVGQDKCFSINSADEHLGHNLLAITFIHALEIDLLPS